MLSVFSIIILPFSGCSVGGIRQIPQREDIALMPSEQHIVDGRGQSSGYW